jgi:hypothetical protein
MCCVTSSLPWWLLVDSRVAAGEHRLSILKALRPVYKDALEQHQENEKRLAPRTQEEGDRLSEQRQPEYLMKLKQEQVIKLKKMMSDTRMTFTFRSRSSAFCSWIST